MLKRMTGLLVAFFIFGRLGVRAQEKQEDTPYSLDTFVNDVLQKNPRLQAYKTRIQSSEARVPQATAWDDPLAAVEFYATPVTSANPFRDGMETDYSLEQAIPLFGQRSLMGDVATANVRMSEQAAAAVERTLVADAKKAYAMLYSAQRRLVVNEENQRLLKQIVESARAKYSVGLATQGDVLKAQVELAKLENERATLEQEQIAAEAMMNGLRADASQTPVGPTEDIKPTEFRDSLDSLLARSMNSRPELRAMNYEIEMNDAEVAAAKRMRLPELMVKGTYKDMKVGANQWAAMFGINIPLAPWGIGKSSGKVEESEMNVRASEQSLVDMQNMVRAEVREAYAKVQSRWQQIDRYQHTILPQAEQSLQSTLAAYQTDKADFLSLIDTYRIVQMFKMEYYMVVGEYAGSCAALERAVGSDLQHR